MRKEQEHERKKEKRREIVGGRGAIDPYSIPSSVFPSSIS